MDAALLARIGDAVRRDASLAALRAGFPGLHFSECSDDDVSPRYRPALTVDGYALYLVSGASGHCLEMSNDPAAATGLLIARLANDE